MKHEERRMAWREYLCAAMKRGDGDALALKTAAGMVHEEECRFGALSEDECKRHDNRSLTMALKLHGEPLVEVCEECGLPVESCNEVSEMKREDLEEEVRFVRQHELAFDDPLSNLFEELGKHRERMDGFERMLAELEGSLPELRERQRYQDETSAHLDGVQEEREKVVALLRTALGGGA